MRQQRFRRRTKESLIIVNSELDGHDIALGLDTGASHTVIDLTPLLIAGYELSQSKGTVQLETASGIIDTYIFEVRELRAIGIHKKNFEVCAYDFLSYHLITDFDGLLGLDFFEDHKLCIDFRNDLLTIQ
jgi:predicted aspartyl protease